MPLPNDAIIVKDCGETTCIKAKNCRLSWLHRSSENSFCPNITVGLQTTDDPNNMSAVVVCLSMERMTIAVI
jgi:hypothetical protein